MTDDMIKALGEKGRRDADQLRLRLSQPEYADSIAPMQRNMAEARRKNPVCARRIRKMLSAEQGAVQPATLADVVAHIDHVGTAASITSASAATTTASPAPQGSR